MERKRIEHSDFKVFIGKWSTEGRIFGTDESPEMEIIGTDTYEPILDGFFLLHQADVLIGNVKSKTFEIMGFMESDAQVSLQYYNNVGAFGLMSGSLTNGEWKIRSKDLRFDGKFTENRNELTGTWQKLDNQKKWVNFIEIKLLRSSPI
jgi:hypothetical protein